MSGPSPAPAPLRRVADLLAALPPEQRATLHRCEASTFLGRPSDDSRTIEAGGTFIAIRRNADGHDFLGQVIEAGAGLLIVQRDRIAAHRELVAAVPRIEIEETTPVMPLLAAGWFGWPGEQLRLAGITGTNGKTTTAHLLGSILRASGRPYLRLGTTGNWLVDHESNAGFTTPFPIELQALLAEARDRGATDGVMEVSSHALAQGRIEPLRYRATALTSFSQDHLDFHRDMADYLATKCKLARDHTRRGGVAVAPVEQGEAARAFLQAAAEGGVERRWRTSRGPSGEAPLEAEIAVLERLPHQGPGLAARVRTPAGELELRSPLVGEYNLDNLLVAIGLALGLELEPDTIATALRTARGAPGRLEPVSLPGCAGPAVYVDYAHTPDAVERALEALRASAEKSGGALIVVLGCGGDRDPSKRPLMGAIASRCADRFFATSDNPRTEDPATIVDQMIAGAEPGGAELVREVDRAAAIRRAITSAEPHDLVLIAGKGHEDYQILGTTKIHFDDREHALEALKARP